MNRYRFRNRPEKDGSFFLSTRIALCGGKNRIAGSAAQRNNKTTGNNQAGEHRRAYLSRSKRFLFKGGIACFMK